MFVLGVIAVMSCYQPRTGADELSDAIEAPSDLFTPAAGEGPECSTPDPSPLSALHVRVRTTSIGGRFAPRNVGAIWIERSSGEFVRTVERWGGVRAKWLLRFVESSGGNVVDAITGPTLISHPTHEVTWDLRALDRCEIAAGDYQVVFELTDRNGAGDSLVVPFAKDQSAQTIRGPDAPHFHDVELALD